MLRGADVTLISGPTAIDPPPFVEVVPVVSAADMFDAVAEHSADANWIFKSAAVADYTPAEYSGDKVKKKDGDMCIPLTRTRDILQYLGDHRRPGQLICGFSMETRDMLANSRGQAGEKACGYDLRQQFKGGRSGLRGGYQRDHPYHRGTGRRSCP